MCVCVCMCVCTLMEEEWDRLGFYCIVLHSIAGAYDVLTSGERQVLKGCQPRGCWSA